MKKREDKRVSSTYSSHITPSLPISALIPVRNHLAPLSSTSGVDPGQMGSWGRFTSAKRIEGGNDADAGRRGARTTNCGKWRDVRVRIFQSRGTWTRKKKRTHLSANAARRDGTLLTDEFDLDARDGSPDVPQLLPIRKALTPRRWKPLKVIHRTGRKWRKGEPVPSCRDSGYPERDPEQLETVLRQGSFEDEGTELVRARVGAEGAEEEVVPPGRFGDAAGAEEAELAVAGPADEEGRVAHHLLEDERVQRLTEERGGGENESRGSGRGAAEEGLEGLWGERGQEGGQG